MDGVWAIFTPVKWESDPWLLCADEADAEAICDGHSFAAYTFWPFGVEWSELDLGL